MAIKRIDGRSEPLATPIIVFVLVLEERFGPSVWNCSAALEGSRFVARQLYRLVSRRLPGMTQRNVLPIASIPWGGYNQPIELPHLETFPGAARYQPIELPSCKAACPT